MSMLSCGTGNCKSCRQKCDKMSDSASLNLGPSALSHGSIIMILKRTERTSHRFDSSIDRAYEIPPTQTITCWMGGVKWRAVQKKTLNAPPQRFRSGKLEEKKREYSLYQESRVFLVIFEFNSKLVFFLDHFSSCWSEKWTWNWNLYWIGDLRRETKNAPRETSQKRWSRIPRRPRRRRRTHRSDDDLMDNRFSMPNEAHKHTNIYTRESTHWILLVYHS